MTPLPPSDAVGVDVGGHGVKAVRVDAEGSVVGRWSDHDPSPEGRSVAAVLDRVARGIEALAPAPRAAVGVAVPGFFDTRSRVVRSSPNFPDWVDVPLQSLLEDRLGRPVIVDNDANAAVAGEAWVGAARGLRDVVMLTLGTGVGTGFLVNGRVVRGARGGAAEGGHVVIQTGGRRCGCGRYGCLETYASGPGLTATAAEVWRHERRADPPGTAARVFELLAAGDEEAETAVGTFVDHLARGITVLLHVFAPEAVVLGGGVATSLEAFRADLEERVRALAIPATAADVFPLRAAALGTSAGAVGAARLAFLHCRGAGAK